MTREFELGDVLTITTGRLVARRHMGAVYDVLNYMTGDDLMTHQLPRAMDECREPLRAQHPALEAVDVPEFKGEDIDALRAELEAWLLEQEATYGAMLTVTPLAPDEHTHIHPLAEIKMMHPDKTVVVVSFDDNTEENN